MKRKWKILDASQNIVGETREPRRGGRDDRRDSRRPRRDSAIEIVRAGQQSPIGYVVQEDRGPSLVLDSNKNEAGTVSGRCDADQVAAAGLLILLRDFSAPSGSCTIRNRDASRAGYVAQNGVVYNKLGDILGSIQGNNVIFDYPGNSLGSYQGTRLITDVAGDTVGSVQGGNVIHNRVAVVGSIDPNCSPRLAGAAGRLLLIRNPDQP